MNTTQRKFALKRIFTILNNKMQRLEKKDELQTKEYVNAGEIPLADILKSFSAGKLKLKNLSVEEIESMTSKTTLANVFDLTTLEKAALKRQSRKEKPTKLISYYDQQVTLGSSDHASQTKFKMLSNYTTARLIAAEFTIAADEIMLGNNSEALACIKRIEEKQF